MDVLRNGTETRSEPAPPAPAAWQRPACEVICLACEISAYVPDEGQPLF